jgi:hypothetical protein
MSDGIENVGVWYNVLGAALQIPGAKVNRAEFLVKEFSKYCNAETISKIISEGTASAGVELRLMDKVAEDAISYHTGVATGLSFAAGIPGGLAMLATVPADIAQYYWHVIVSAQKLAYIYGLKDLAMAEDHFKSLLTLLIGAMCGIEEADKTVTQLYSAQVSQEIALMTVVKSMNKTVLKVAVALAYRLTGKTVFKSVWKAIPIIGGVVSGGITLFTFRPMCDKLRSKLHDSVKSTRSKVLP